MKFLKTLATALICPLFACLLVAGCSHMPSFGFMGPKYQPLDSDVAAMAAPAAPGGTRKLYCKVGNGSAHFGKKWRDYDSDDFLLAQGRRVNVTLTEKKGGETMAFQGYFDDAGQKMIFCPVVSGPPDKRIPCASLYALDDDLSLGIKRTFDIPGAVRGANITCAFRREKLRKL
ncbi:MAG: hypothetical protein GC185_03030 [Alphaproteobacteria bacterium]|nr:hypothetical protein [Alphaproteobacteria bacterium]